MASRTSAKKRISDGESPIAFAQLCRIEVREIERSPGIVDDIMRGRHLGRRSGHFSSQLLAVLAATAPLSAGLASGCSWLYDPDDLVDYIQPEPPPEPLDCWALSLAPLPSSFALLEGIGDFESRPAVLVVAGTNITPLATLAVTDMNGLPVTGVEIAGPSTVTGGYGTHIATPMIARVNRALANLAETPLKITVAQGCEADLNHPEPRVVSQSIEWRLLGFDELISTGTVTYNTDMTLTYSVVDIGGGLSAFGDAPAKPLILRSNSSITVGGPIEVNADETSPGAGGGVGGAGTGNGSGPGAGQGFPAALLTAGNGGGAGFATAAGGTLAGPPAGDPFITHYDNINRGSGGGGGAVLLGGPGGVGGGGGGTVELSALGTTTLRGTISARGGDGGGNNANSAGGGGSGGVIVVRGGKKVDAQMTFDVVGGSSRATANGGALGRVRIDSPEQVVAEATKDLAVRGVTFPVDLPITTDKGKTDLFEISLVGSPRANVEVVVSDINKAVVDTAQVNFETASQATVEVTLARGYNRICVSPVSMLSASKAGSTNCVELANIPNYVQPPDPNGKQR